MGPEILRSLSGWFRCDQGVDWPHYVSIALKWSVLNLRLWLFSLVLWSLPDFGEGRWKELFLNEPGSSQVQAADLVQGYWILKIDSHCILFSEHIWVYFNTKISIPPFLLCFFYTKCSMCSFLYWFKCLCRNPLLAHINDYLRLND